MTTATTDRRYLNRKQRELNTLRGIPNRVDAAEARAHLLKLRRTMGWTHVAAATRCSAAHLRNIVSGRTIVINRVTHEKILAVRPAPTRDAGFYIDALPTVRRVRALMARGHSQQAIATAAGTTQHRVSLVSLGPERVRQKLADKIAAAYEQLAHFDGTSARAGTIARTNGWHDPQFWEDTGRIDDVSFDPAATPQAPRALYIAEEARWLMGGGLSKDEVAKQIGVSRFYVDKALRDYPDAEQAAA